MIHLVLFCTRGFNLKNTMATKNTDLKRLNWSWYVNCLVLLEYFTCNLIILFIWKPND